MTVAYRVRPCGIGLRSFTQRLACFSACTRRSQEKVDVQALVVEDGDMSMNIKSAVAHQMARELAAVEGTTVTDAVTGALRLALERHAHDAAVDRRRQKLESFMRHCGEVVAHDVGPSIWQVADDLFDGQGLPR